MESDKLKALGYNLEEVDLRDFTVYENDSQMKRKIGLPQLTAARVLSQKNNV